MSWIIQEGWAALQRSVLSDLLWQEVKGSSVAAGINRADMFRSGPNAACERCGTDAGHYNISTYIWLEIDIWAERHNDITFALRPFQRGPMRIAAVFGAKKLTSEPPDAQSESFSLLFQQHVPSYYKIHVEAGTMFLIFHTRGDKVNMQESEDRYQTRRVIANWVMFGYTLHAL